MQTQVLLDRLYRPLLPRRVRPGLLQRVRRALKTRAQARPGRLAVAAGAVAVWMTGHVYYYNELVSLESNVQAAWAQIEAARQQRDHLLRSVTPLLQYHAAYERGVLGDMTTLRAKGQRISASTSSGPALTPPLLGELKATAEQYPELRLGETVQELSRVFVANENEITKRIANYNDMVNIYTTALQQFPRIVFARTMGFRKPPYYTPSDVETLQYREPRP